MPVPEILARAMLVDHKCKRLAREYGADAQKLAKKALNSAGQDRRVQEVLANQLNEAAGKLRYAPPILDDASSRK